MDPESCFARAEVKEAVQKVLTTLTPKEAQVLKMRFGFDGGESMTRSEVASHFQISSGRIGQIESKAFRKIRHPSRANYLKRRLFGGIPKPSSIPPKSPEERYALSRQMVYARLEGEKAEWLRRELGIEHKDTEEEKARRSLLCFFCQERKRIINLLVDDETYPICFKCGIDRAYIPLLEAKGRAPEQLRMAEIIFNKVIGSSG